VTRLDDDVARPSLAKAGKKAPRHLAIEGEARRKLHEQALEAIA
jgi:hypothetical protein